MPCCGISLDYFRMRLETDGKKERGIGYQVACDLLFPEGEIKDTESNEDQKEESGEY